VCFQPVELPPLFQLLNATKPVVPSVDLSASKPEVLVQPAEDLPPLDEPLLLFLPPTKPPTLEMVPPPQLAATPFPVPPVPPQPLPLEIVQGIVEVAPPPPPPQLVDPPATVSTPEVALEPQVPSHLKEDVVVPNVRSESAAPVSKITEAAGKEKDEDPTNAEFPPEIRIQLLNQTDA